MSKDIGKTEDPLIDEVRQRREGLITEHGGLRAWVKHLQELQKGAPQKAAVTGRRARRPRRPGGPKRP